MRSKCVLNNNTNLNLRTQTQKLKISKSPFSQTQQYHQILKPHIIKSTKNTTQPIQTKKSQTQNNSSHLKRNPTNPPQANPDPVAMLPANELFSDGKLVPLQLSSVKRERAHPPENRIAHSPKNHQPIVNPLARPD